MSTLKFNQDRDAAKLWQDLVIALAPMGGSRLITEISDALVHGYLDRVEKGELKADVRGLWRQLVVAYAPYSMRVGSKNVVATLLKTADDFVAAYKTRDDRLGNRDDILLGG